MPAALIIVLGCLSIVSSAFYVVYGSFRCFDPAEREKHVAVVMIMMFAVLLLVSAISAWGGWNMLKLRSFTWAMIGAMTIIPGACCFSLFGVPLGVWAIMILASPEIRSAFQSEKEKVERVGT